MSTTDEVREIRRIFHTWQNDNRDPNGRTLQIAQGLATCEVADAINRLADILERMAPRGFLRIG